MSFKKNLFKNILVSGGYTYLSQLINFASSIIVSRILTPANYGLMGLITVFTGFILIFSDGGLSYALIRSDYGRTYQRILTNLSWILGSVLFLITVIMAYPISLFYKNSQLFWPTIVLSTTFLIRGLSLAQGALLAKQLKFGFIGKVTLICMVISVIITVILAYLGAAYWSLVIPQIFTAIITAIYYEREVKLGFKIFPLSYIKVGFKHTKRLIGSVIGFNTINYWSRNTDNMLVGKMYGAADLGIYNRAYSLLILPLSLITGLFNTILFPSMKKLQTEGGDIESEYYFVLRVITFLSYPLVIIFILFPHQLVLLLWGKNWLQVAVLLPYFGLLIFTQTLSSTCGSLLILYKKEREFMISGWVGAFFLISAIVIGAFISLKAIAQFYSISFFLFVLSFTVYYTFVYSLKFNKARVWGFWMPKILFSTLIWLSLYFDVLLMKQVLLGLLTAYLFFDCRKEIGKIILLIKKRI
ncbi:oligosaccharide flippase family protein [Mucilaginibacter sp. 22184]|uniref:oligosaccharide flippase family protein n=1 Tax=Mucilaginibacter sp. 22184 TaxID=3453887 RepID=UPI003F82E47F